MTDAFVKNIPIECLQRGRYQPRRTFDKTALEELANSIKKNGLVQPIIVHPLDNHQYEIVAGERRWRATQLAGLSDIPCIIKHYSDAHMAAVATVENINRVDLNPIEEASAYQKMIDQFQYTHDEIASIVGKSREKISNLLRLLKLEDNVKKYLTEGLLKEGHGKLLAALEPKTQYLIAKQCIREKWSVYQLDKQLKKQTRPQKTLNNDLKRFENAIADYFSTQVTLEPCGNNAGFLKIKYHDLDTLMGIVEKMGLVFEP